MEENTMRYNSSRNRIVRSLGVLVGAALIAGLVLPSAVQAQGRQPEKPTVRYVGGDAMRTTVSHDVDVATGHTYWVFSVVNPSGGVTRRAVAESTGNDKDLTLDAGGGGGHGEWEADVYSVEAAGQIGIPPRAVTRSTRGAIRVDPAPMTPMPASDPAWVAPVNSNAATTSPKSATTLYTHGQPTAPALFEYSTPAATVNLFTWTDANRADTAITGYRLRWTKDDPGRVGAKWESAPDQEVFTGTYRLTPDDLEKVEANTAYTFELSALGTSSFVGAHYGSDSKVKGMASRIAVVLGMPSGAGTPPIPTPTLPEWAALFLAMLLLGSGAYLLRGRRQQGGLTL